MLNQEELKEIATLQADGSYFVSLYLNVSPGTKGDYVIHFKNMIKNISEETDKKILKKIKGDIEKLEAFVTSNKREFKKDWPLSLLLKSHSGRSIILLSL